MRWRRRQRCFSGSIRNWDNSFNHPLIETIVVKKAKGKETKSFVRLVLPVPNDFASFLFLFINLLMLYWFPHSAIVSTLPPQPEAALSHSKPDSPAPFQREDAAFFQAPVPAGFPVTARVLRRIQSPRSRICLASERTIFTASMRSGIRTS